MKILGEVMRAVHSRDVSRVISLGTNAVQAAAQVLRLRAEAVSSVPEDWGKVEIQGLAILRFNGVKVALGPSGPDRSDDLNRLAEWNGDSADLMRSSDPFIRELACLHGVDERRRYDSLLDSAFDWDESLPFDAISQLNQSSSGWGY